MRVLKSISVIFLLCVLMGSPNKSTAQYYPIKAYTISDGLPQMQVESFLQDSKGYFWIGTRNGVSRFDGHHFVNFYLHDGLASNRVLKLLEDRSGIVWVLTKRGISGFNKGSFQTWFFEPGDGHLEGLASFTEGEDGLYCLRANRPGSPGEIYLFKDGVFIKTKIRETSNINQYFNDLHYKIETKELLLTTENGQLFGIRGGGVTKLGDKNIHILRTPDGRIYYSDIITRTIFRYEKGALVDFKKDAVGFEEIDPILVYPDGRNRITLYGTNGSCSIPWKDGNIFCAYNDREGTLWLYGEDGLFKVLSKSFLNYTRNEGLNPHIWSVVEDPFGKLWFASLTDGLQYLENDIIKDFQGCPVTDRINFYMGSRRLSNGETWFTHQRGILSRDGQGVKSIRYLNSETFIVYENPAKNEILAGAIECLLFIKDGVVHRIPEVSHYTDYGFAVGICHDTSGQYWIGTSRSLVRFDGMDVYPVYDEDRLAFPVISLDADSCCRIWLGTAQGLFYYDPVEDSIKAAFSKEFNEPVNFVKLLNKRYLMVGRMRDLLLLDLSRLQEGRPQIAKVYDAGNGFLGNECGQNGVTADGGGNYWINTHEMVIRFNPDIDETPREAPSLHLASVQFGSGLEKPEVSEIEISRDKTIQLTSYLRNNTLRINLSAVTSVSPERIEFYYRTGLGDNWSGPVKEPFIILGGLSPGVHTIEIYCKRKFEEIKSPPLVLNIKVLTPFYKSVWFLVIVTLLLSVSSGFAVYLVIRIRFKRKQAREALAREYLKTRLGNIVRHFDPHFAFNIMSAIGGMIMKGERKEAYKYLVGFSNMLRDLLRDQDRITKTLQSEFEFIKNYCEMQKLRLGEKFNFEIRVDERIDPDLELPKMLTHSLVENALKHGIEPSEEGGNVCIEAVMEKTRVLIRIADTGIGRERASRNGTKGLGTGNMTSMDLIQMLNISNKDKIILEIMDNQPRGTVATLSIPLGFEYYFN